MLTTVVAPASPGDSRLYVNRASMSQLWVGRWVQLRLDDASTIPPPTTDGSNPEVDSCQQASGAVSRLNRVLLCVLP